MVRRERKLTILVYLDKSVLFATYGERWRAYRKALHIATMQKNVDSKLITCPGGWAH